MPTRTEGLRRLDRNTRLPHRPATALADDLAVATDDSLSVALWRAHIERTLRAARTLKAGPPTPRLAARDPFALRGLVLFLVIATFFAAGGERMKRIAAAFDWQGVMLPANFRLDAWVSPPPYTGKPPVILQGLRPGEPVQQNAATLSVPSGSTLVIRATGQVRLDVVTTGGLSEAKKPDGQAATAKGTEEHRYVINEAGAVTVRGIVASDVTWKFTAIPDRPPTIALAKDPEGQGRGALQLSYKLEDDYGVVGAQATFKLQKNDGTNGNPPRALYEAPDFALVLPQARTRNGVGQTTKDLTEHPWAGADVAMTLVARDEGGNEGSSAPFEMRLPERPFSKPVARALIEQRRILALDGDAQARVLTALDALTMAPEKFNIESNVYLGLRAILSQLVRAKSDDQMRDVVARMWDMAVQLEDGNVSDTEAALRAAQEALRQALERGASDEELKRLTDDLRAALDKFLQALAEQLRRNPEQLARPLDPNARQLRPQDLKNMIDRLEQMARSGAKDAARQLLQELQSMLENLQMARPGQMQDGDDDMMNQLDQLGDMIRRQQQLRDRTFQQGQDQRRQRGQQGSAVNAASRASKASKGQQGDQDGMGDLRDQQQALRDQLNKLMEELKKRGFGQQPGPGRPARRGRRRHGSGGRPARRRQCRRRRRFPGPCARGDAPRGAESRAVDAAAGHDGPRPRPAGPPRPAARPAANRSARPAVARARLWRRRHREGAGRDRRAARAPHPRRAAPPLRRELPPAARTRIYRAAAAGLLFAGRRRPGRARAFRPFKHEEREFAVAGY